jgi:hypothetical protein
LTLSAAVVESHLRFLRTQQLITGELPSYEVTGDWGLCYVSRPLYSAICFDALGCLDPDSSTFESHTMDRFPVANRRRISAVVWNLRWRLRTYLAWEEEADGSWRAAGRHSSSEGDAATTASASIALLNHTSTRTTVTQNRRVSVLQRWLQGGMEDGASRAHALCYLSLAGADTGRLIQSMLEDCRTSEGDPMQWYAVARSWRRAALPDLHEVAKLLIPRLLTSLRETAGSPDPFQRALIVSALLDLGYAGPALAGNLDLNLTDSRLLAAHTDSPFISPTATVALSLSNALRAQMRIPRPRLD